jgi:hypothetical protein
VQQDLVRAAARVTNDEGLGQLYRDPLSRKGPVRLDIAGVDDSQVPALPGLNVADLTARVIEGLFLAERDGTLALAIAGILSRRVANQAKVIFVLISGEITQQGYPVEPSGVPHAILLLRLTADRCTDH